MSYFHLLKDPQQYVPQDWDLSEDDAGREYWLGHFEDGFTDAMVLAERQYGREARRRIEAATREFSETIRKLRSDPAALTGGKLGVLDLDLLRERVLREHHLSDPYTSVKSRANTTAQKLYPQVVRTLHAMEDDQMWEHLVRGVLGGNLFDLGASREMNPGADPEDFLTALDEIKPRPWLVDDFDVLVEDLLFTPLKWGKAVVFVDNAGPDFVLGIIPLVRELALHGAKIVLGANEGPALNDITVDEVIDVLESLAREDPELSAMIGAEMFEVVSTGSRIPLLDLRDVSDELNEAATDADLVILEGMGRAVETNFDATFSTDSLWVALLKNPRIAARIAGQMGDCVCKYVPVDS